MNIDSYLELDDKENKFESYKINSPKCFDTFLNDFSSKKISSVFFRGSNEAKYMLYNSGQRAWLMYELNTYMGYEDGFIGKQIKNVREAQRGLLAKFYKNLGYRAYDLTLLSFLQHYGGATPFLDWTEDINVALYFALDGLKQFPAKNNTIDNYFSVYVVEEEDLDSWQKLINNKIKEIKTRKLVEVEINNPFYFKAPFYLKWGLNTINWKTNKPFLININGENLNIINQKGLFIFNPNQTEPLEQAIIPKKMKCYNIHKSLSEYIRQKLDKAKITTDFIYPQEEDIARIALLNVRRQLI